MAGDREPSRKPAPVSLRMPIIGAFIVAAGVYMLPENTTARPEETIGATELALRGILSILLWSLPALGIILGSIAVYLKVHAAVREGSD